MYHALKLNGKLISRPISNVALLEQQRDLLPPDQKNLAEIVPVTEDGKEILFG